MYGYATYDLVLRKATGSELFRYDLESFTWDIVKTYSRPPGPRSIHYSCIYLDELYIFYGLMPEYSYEYDSIFKFNFKTGNWTAVGVNTSHKNFLATSLLISNKFYFIYGRNFKSFMNSVSFIDLNKPGLFPEYLSPNWVSPSSRVYHCSFIVNDNMYIFGGSNGDNSINEKFYNDIWSFSLTSEKWSLVKQLGLIPSERSNFGSIVISGDVFIIFGVLVLR